MLGKNRVIIENKALLAHKISFNVVPMNITFRKNDKSGVNVASSRYFEHIDGLRAVAVMAVLLSHLNYSWCSGGFVGVDVFFVISGFLITNLILREIEETGSFSFLHFYTRRAKRILPALFVMLIFSFAAAIYFLNLAKFPNFGGSMAASALSFSNIFFNNQSGYFDIFSRSNPLLNTWSLGVEEQFYLVWPLLLLVASKFNSKTIWVTIIFIFFTSLYLNIKNQDGNLTELYYLSQYRAFEFCIGALLVLFVNFKPRKNFTLEIFFAVGAALVLVPSYKFDSDTLFPSYNALYPAIGAALLIYSGDSKILGLLLKNRVARRIGIISYSLYLFHWPIITFVKTYNEDIGQGFSMSSASKILVIFVSIIIAEVVYRKVERPFRKIGDGGTEKRVKILSTSVAVAIGLAGLGATAYYSDGWLWRANSPSVVKSTPDLKEFHRKHWGGAGFSGGYIFHGATSYPKIVMMGDSHSGMLDTGMVREVAKPYDLTVYTVSGGGAGKYASSLMLPGITRIAKDQSLYDKSDREGPRDVVSALTKSKNPTLIYSASYSGQIDIAGYLATHKALGIDTHKMDNIIQYKPFLDGLDRLRKMIHDKKLVIIGDVPGASFDVMKCATRLSWFNNSSCKYRDKIGRNKSAININRVLFKYAKSHENVYFINPYNAFCSDGYCRSVDENGNPFYSDGSHLSKVGSNYFVAVIRKRLLSIVRYDRSDKNLASSSEGDSE